MAGLCEHTNRAGAVNHRQKGKMMTSVEERINELFKELVPAIGSAETLAGEIIRAICRIEYRNYNDGDHIGVGYGNETCNSAARFLMEMTTDEIKDQVLSIWGCPYDDEYDEGLARLKELVLEHVEDFPELKEVPLEKDMFSYTIREEDIDWEDDEYYY